MFLILKLIIIITVYITYGYITQESEIILLPAIWNLTEAKEMSLTFKVFGKLVQLNMRRNNEILLPVFEEWKDNINSVTEKSLKVKVPNSCFYFYEDYFSSVAINICQEYGLEGLVFLENDVLEIRPLRNVFEPLSFTDNFCIKKESNKSFGKRHIITKFLKYNADLDSHFFHKNTSKRSIQDKKTLKNIKNEKKFTIELAIFVSVDVYNSLRNFLNFDKEDIVNAMLSYVNWIQYLYHHPSLGVQIDISLVRLDIMEKQLPLLQSNIFLLTNHKVVQEAFCKYSANLNPPSDDDLRHWDIALYIVKFNLYKTARGETSFIPRIIHGISKPTNGVCNSNSCAIVSLSLEQSIYFYIFFMSPRFLKLLQFQEALDRSSLAAAHEIGHLLRLKYELEGECSMYVMCKCRDCQLNINQIKWSLDSSIQLKSNLEYQTCLLDHTKSQNIDYDGHYWPEHAFDNRTCYNHPGREQTAKAQCESFMHDDENANVVTLHDICKNLQCETPLKNGSVFAGRALNGTYCGYRKECCNGECAPIIESLYIFKYCKKYIWSEWKKDPCKSNCLVKSKGTVVKRRFCEHRKKRTANCPGPYYDVDLCDDSLLCTANRITIAEFTTAKCGEFKKHANRANMTVELLIAPGNQMPHDSTKPWVACTVFCRRSDIPKWYAPRQEMLDYNVDPYFPDGTWCHNEGGQDYYCYQHYCLPENYSLVKCEIYTNNC